MGISFKQKHIDLWVRLTREIASVSNCPRAKFGALVIDEDSNTLIASGYNGFLRGGPPLCGGEVCVRDSEGIPSGTSVEIGCIHAEMNVIINCARETVSSQKKVLFVNGEPCRMCSKLIIQAGIRKVYVVGGIYENHGLDFLGESGVAVEVLDG